MDCSEPKDPRKQNCFWVYHISPAGSSFSISLQWGTLDAEIKVLFAVSPEQSEVLYLKPGVGQNMSMHASDFHFTSPFNFMFLISSPPSSRVGCGSVYIPMWGIRMK